MITKIVFWGILTFCRLWLFNKGTGELIFFRFYLTAVNCTNINYFLAFAVSRKRKEIPVLFDI